MHKISSINLNEFTAESGTKPNLAALINAIAKATIEISALINKGALADIYGKLNTENVQGETQATLDVISDNIFTACLTATGLVAGVVSEEVELPVQLTKDADYLVMVDPLDGSSNVDVNLSVGSIFSIYLAPKNLTNKLKVDDYLIPGKNQLAAGYAIYGPSTMLVITLGNGTHGFTLDCGSNEYMLTHPNMQIPIDTNEYSINTSNQRHWQPAMCQYVADCNAGVNGVRQKNFNMRWTASMAADIHRILMRGGVYLYPRDNKDATKAGRIRLIYESNPMAMIVKQAGGAASTGTEAILEMQPTSIHQRISTIIGSKNEVAYIEQLYKAHGQNLAH